MTPPRPLDFRPDGQIERGHLPPPSWYADEDVYARALDRVFARSWQWIGDERQVPEPGDVRPFALLPGSLDEPLVLVNDGGTRRVLSNVCTHRCMRVVDAPRRLGGLRCPYHGRRFDLGGRFVSSPGFEDAENFPGPDENLPRLELASFGGLLFTALDPDAAFDSVFAPLAERLGHLPLASASPLLERARDFEFDGPWAAYVENYLDGLHIPFLHAGLNAAIDWERYDYELFDGGAWQIAEARADEPALELPSGHPDASSTGAGPSAAGGTRRIAAWYALVHPNLMLNAYPWGLSINVVEPLGPRRTRVRFRAYVNAPELLGRGAGADLDRVEREDEVAVAQVARGQRARLARRGRYAPRHERALRHFHAWVAERTAR